MNELLPARVATIRRRNPFALPAQLGDDRG
jgi:hypothetical protein